MENKDTKNRRQVYIWPENLEFFTGLANKSKFLNLLIKQYRESLEMEDEDANII